MSAAGSEWRSSAPAIGGLPCAVSGGRTSVRAKPRTLGLGDERSATIPTGRLLIAGSTAVVFSMVPALFVARLCDDAPWWMVGCWGSGW